MQRLAHAWRRFVAGALCFIGIATLGHAGSESDASATTANADAVRPRLAVFQRAPVAFEANQGQVHPEVRFSARGRGYQLFLTDTEVVLRLTRLGPGAARSAAGPTPIPLAERPASIDESVLRMTFPGALAGRRAQGERPAATRSNYFRGGASTQRHRNVRNFSRVRYPDLYPGIDLVLYGNQRELEYDFIVKPGADPATIRLDFDGAEELSIDSAGDLVVRMALGELRQRRPQVYQEIAGERRPVEGRYVRLGADRVGFEVGSYDRTAVLVIDPIVSYATYLGGGDDDGATAIAVDSAGNAYVAGYTASSDFPTRNAYDRSLGRGSLDVFIAKLNASGSALVYSTYLGGASGRDIAYALAVDGSGSVYVTGQTNGSDFPTTATAYQRGVSGGGSFVTKLSPTGSSLVYSTYLHGVTTKAIAVDASGRASLTGSAGAVFTTTTGALQPSTRNAASTNAFVAKLNAGGTGLVFGTYLGGTGTDVGTGIALDASGNIYAAGHTSSADFPTNGAYQASLQGGRDGFVAKLDPSGSALMYSTFIGGALDDFVHAVAVDGAGSAYVTGETYSGDFPTRNAFQSAKPGRLLLNRTLGSSFVAKLSAEGNALVYSSFFGGEVCTTNCQSYVAGGTYPGDVAYAIAVDRTGYASVTGVSRSYDLPITTFLAPRKQNDQQQSLVVAKFSAAGDALMHSTLLQTSNASSSWKTGMTIGIGNAIALDPAGNAYLAGIGSSFTAFPLTPGAFQPAIAGLEDAVVIKLASVSVAMSLGVSPAVADSLTPVTLTATVAAGASGTVTFHSGTKTWGSAAVNDGTAVLTTTFPAGVHRVRAIFRGSGTDGDAGPAYLVVDPHAACG